VVDITAYAADNFLIPNCHRYSYNVKMLGADSGGRYLDLRLGRASFPATGCRPASAAAAFNLLLSYTIPRLDNRRLQVSPACQASSASEIADDEILEERSARLGIIASQLITRFSPARPI